MVVCHCKGISDRELRGVIRNGARCRGAVARACGAGAGARCGGCRPTVDEILAEERAVEPLGADATRGEQIPRPLPLAS